MRRQVSELKKTIEETKNMTVQKLIYLGKILDAFDAAALAKSTVFVLWSDHGWSLGDNDLWSSERC